jgi:hypothetical protein
MRDSRGRPNARSRALLLLVLILLAAPVVLSLVLRTAFRLVGFPL